MRDRGVFLWAVFPHIIFFVYFCSAMTKRYFIFLGFDGRAYHGWQVQPNGNSVQAELEKALSTLLRQPTEVVGAGRTDAGVHARDMAAHFDTEVAIDCSQLAYKLNRLLPSDISVREVREVSQDMHPESIRREERRNVGELDTGGPMMVHWASVRSPRI